MVDGVLLLVDAAEGPLPGTKFVLKKALDLNLKPIVVINKIDRKDARAYEVLDEVFDLFMSLGATDEQLDFPTSFTIGNARASPSSTSTGRRDHAGAAARRRSSTPCRRRTGDRRCAVPDADHDDRLQRLPGAPRHRPHRARHHPARRADEGRAPRRRRRRRPRDQDLQLRGPQARSKSKRPPPATSSLSRAWKTSTSARRSPTRPTLTPLSFVSIEEPTIAMNFLVNNSPFAGQEGRYVTTRNLGERACSASCALTSLCASRPTETAGRVSASAAAASCTSRS